VENRSYRRLSRYYEVPDDQVPEGKMPEWARPQLLVKGKHRHDYPSCQQHSAYPNS